MHRRKMDNSKATQVNLAIRALYQRLLCLPDWRKRLVEYSLAYLISLVFIFLLTGNNNVRSIESAIACNEKAIKSRLEAGRYQGAPSDITLQRALQKVIATMLLTIISEWSTKWFGVFRADSYYAIDGKAIRTAPEKVCVKKPPPYILNAFSAVKGYSVAQLKIDKSKSRLSVMCDLFKMLPMVG